MILAAGSSTEEAVESWAHLLVRKLQEDWPKVGHRCERAWQGSAQKDRKDLVGRILGEAGNDLVWLQWYRFSDFIQSCGCKPPPLPTQKRVSRAALEQVEPETHWIWKAEHLAASRLHVARQPLWPLAPAFSGLLNLWPSSRRWYGSRLQSFWPSRSPLWTCRKRRNFSRELVPRLKNRPPVNWQALWLVIWREIFTKDMPPGLAIDLAGNVARYLASQVACYLTPDLANTFAHDLAYDLARFLARDLQRGFAHELTGTIAANYAGGLARNFARNFAGNFASNFAHFSGFEQRAGLLDFAKVEVVSTGRSAARFALAILDPTKENGIARVFCLASRLSCQGGSVINAFEEALAESARPSIRSGRLSRSTSPAFRHRRTGPFFSTTPSIQKRRESRCAGASNSSSAAT